MILSAISSAAGFVSAAAQATSANYSATALLAAGSQASASALSASSEAATMATPGASVSSGLPAPVQPVAPMPAPVAPGFGDGVFPAAAAAAAASYPGIGMATFGVSSAFGGYPSSQSAGTPTDYGSAAPRHFMLSQ